jgi:hypothetical protein
MCGFGTATIERTKKEISWAKLVSCLGMLGEVLGQLTRLDELARNLLKP